VSLDSGLKPTSAVFPPASKLVKALLDAGIIPAQCTRFDLHISFDDVIRATYEVIVSEEQFEKIAATLKDNPEEAKAFARALLAERPRALGQGRQDREVLEVKDL